MNVFFFISFCMAKIDRPLIYTTKRYLHKYMKRHFLARLFKCNNKNLPSTLKFEVNTSKKKELFFSSAWHKIQRSLIYHDHGLRTPKEAFFHQNPKLLGLGRQLGQINFGAFGVFLADFSAPILVL